MRAIVVSIAAMGGIAASPAPFRYITVEQHALRSAVGVPVKVGAPSDFRLLAPTSRRAVFGNHPYEVSLGALARDDAVVMLHAEKVSDGSGASNYDKLPASPLAGFHIRSQCASIGADDVLGEHDLNWLAQRGWNPVGNLALEQHLKSSPDHNREVVVSFITKVKDCSDKQSVDSALTKLRSKIRVTTR